jgi:hypothetical protein
MKRGLFAGFAVLAGILALRSTEVRPSQASKPERIRPAVQADADARVTPTVLEPRGVRLEENRTAPAAGDRKSAGASLETRLFRSLQLSESQQEIARQALFERDEALAAYRREVLDRGFLRVSECELRLEEIRETAYRRLCAPMSREQVLRFQELRERGGFDDPIEFEGDDSLVILD